MSEYYEEEEARDRRYSEVYAPLKDRYDSNIKELTDPKRTIDDFELFLRCLRRDSNGNLVKIGGDKEWKPLMNDEGINRILSSLQSVVHQMNTLSNLKEESIEHLYNTLKENIIFLLAFKRISVAVDRKDRDMIIGNALRISYGFMLRAFEEGDRKFWKGTTTEVMHRQENVKPKPSGFSINPWQWNKKS